MSNSLSWLDNKVLNPDSSYQSSQAATSGRALATTAGASSTYPSVSGTVLEEPEGSGLSVQGPPPVTSPYYIPGYLSRNIGKNVRAEFILGTAFAMDKTGILREVGVNYFVLEDYITHAMIMCDLYSVKFVTTL